MNVLGIEDALELFLLFKLKGIEEIYVIVEFTMRF